MELFYIELVSTASSQLFSDKTLCSFSNFWLKQLNLEGQSKIAILEKSYSSMYQKISEKQFMFFDENFSSS